MMDDIKTTLMGDLPNWIPERQRVKFSADMVALRNAHGLTDEYIAEQVAEVLAVHAESMKDAAFDLHIERGRSVMDGQPVSDQVARRIRMIQFVAMIVQAVRLGPLEGLALLTDPALAGKVEKGVSYGRHQADIASNPRGKVGDDGKTNRQIIGRLARACEYRELSAKQLLTHYISELDGLGLNPTETPAGNDWKEIVIEYDFKGGRKTITGGQFAKVVSAYRTGKKLP